MFFQSARNQLTFLVFLLLAGPGSVLAAPITFNTALPVARGEFLNREQLVLKRSGKDPSGLNSDIKANALVSVLAYGISGKLTIFGVLPYLDNELRFTMPGVGSARRSSRGFGDASVFMRYTLHQNDQQGSTLRLAVFGGVKVPTGNDTQSDAFGPLPIPLQSGSGSWDGFGGLVTTWQTLNFQLDAQLCYAFKTEANNFQAGNEARLDGSVQYRLLPRELKSGVPAFVYAVLETNLIQRGKNTISGRTDPNSGGTSIFLAPGIQYVTRRYILEAAVQFPIVQNLNGQSLKNDYIARTGFRWNF